MKLQAVVEGAKTLPMIEQHYSPSQLCRILSLSRSAVQQRLYDGTFPHVRIGDRILIPESSIKRAETAATFHLLARISEHKDPFDRMLVWMSIREKFTFVSRDRHLHQYIPLRLKVCE